MSSVDDRIVNMQFNNKQFTQGASESKRSLQDLETAVGNASKSKGLADMGKQVEQVTGRFSAMRIAGITAVATIANKAVNAGIQLVKSFTLGPIQQGLKEYQTNLKSIQTVVANTGMKSKQGFATVQAGLDKLNDYSDQTIYNFSEMASAVGRFTAAGVKLKPSIDAIRGMANVAALTGANAEDLNRAMYQMSQALSAGTIRLMDWKSLENANMGTSNMRKAIMATAHSLGEEGVAMDAALKKHGNFRDSLTEGWLSAEVFNKSMKVMGGRYNKNTKEVEAFTVAQLKNMGYTDQQAKDLNKLSKAALESATRIKSLPQLMDVLKESLGSVWATAFKGFFGNLKESSRTFTVFGDFFSSGVKKLNKQLESFFAVFNRPVEKGEANARIDFFVSILYLIKAIVRPLQSVSDAFGDVFGGSEGGAKNVESLARGFRALVRSMIPSVETMGQIRQTFRGVFAVLHIGYTVLKGLGALFGSFFGELFKGAQDGSGGILEFTARIGQMLFELDKFLTSGGEFVDVMGKIGSEAGKLAGQGLDIAGNFIMGIVNGLTGGPQLGQLKNSVMEIGTKVIDWIKERLGIHSPAAELVPVGQNIVKGVAEGVLDGVIWVIGAIGKVVKAIFNAFGSMFKGADAVTIGAMLNTFLTGALIGVVIKFIRGLDKFRNSFSEIFGEMKNTLEDVQGALKANALKSIAIAVGILVASVIALQFVDPVKVAAGTGAIAALMGVMVTALHAMGGLKSKGLKKGGKELAQNAIQINALAGAMVAMASAVLILSTAVSLLGRQDPAKVWRGMGAILVLMAVMTNSLVALAKTQGMVTGAAAAFVAMALAMNILVTAVLAFGHMNWKTLLLGIGSIAILLGLMTSSLVSLAKAGPMAEGAAGALIALSVGMLVMSKAVQTLGKMKFVDLAKGVGAFAIMLTLLTTSIELVAAAGPLGISAAASIIAVAAGMMIMAKAIKLMGEMKLWDLIKGLAALAWGLTIFLVAGAAAIPLAPGILALGAALFLAGTGIGAFAAGLALLATVGTAGVAVITAAFSAFIALLPALAAQVAAAFVSFVTTIAAAAPRVRKAMTTIITNLLGVIQDAIRPIGDLILELIHEIIRVIRESAADILETGFFLVRTISQGILDNMDFLVGRAVDLITGFATALATESNVNKIVDAMWTVMKNVATALGKKGWSALKGMSKAAMGLAKALVTNIPKQLKDAIMGAVKVAVEWAKKKINDMIPDWLPGQGKKDSPKAPGKIGGVAGGGGVAGPVMSPGDLNNGADIMNGAGRRVAEQISINKAKPKSKYPPYIQRWVDALAKGIGKGISTGVLGSVGTAIYLANKAVAQNNAYMLTLQEKYRSAQLAAEATQARADAARLAAGKYGKKSKKRKQLTDTADRLDKAAAAAQAKADARQAAIDAQKEFNDADAIGKGDIYAQRAQDLTDKSIQLMARAKAEMELARKLKKSNRKAYEALMKQAKADAAAAKKAGEDAADADRKAGEQYQAAVDARAKELEDLRKAEEKARADQAEYDAADDAGKAAILEARAKEQDDNAAKAMANYNKLLADAKSKAKTDAEAAMELLDQAQTALDEANAAIDKAKEDRDQAKEIREGGSGGGGGTGSGPIMPSRSVLEDAASSVDRYNASLIAANAAIQAAPGIQQFVQNNYSPAALDATTLYRQTNNLLSNAEIKMGSN